MESVERMFRKCEKKAMNNFDDRKNELYHHGILGMKWGVRRYQNKDGTLTSAGKKHLADKIKKADTKTTSRLYYNSFSEDSKHKNLRKQTSFLNKLDRHFSDDRSVQKKYGYDGTKYGESTQYEANKAYTKALAAYYKDNGYTLKKARSIREGFRNEVGKRINTILGEKANMPIKSVSGNKTTVGQKVVDSVISDHRKADSSERLNRLGIKDHLAAAVVGALAGPYAASAYTASRLARDRK